MSKMCCGTVAELIEYTTFKYHYCRVCKSEVRDSENTISVKPATKEDVDAFYKWQLELEELFKGDIT